MWVQFCWGFFNCYSLLSWYLISLYILYVCLFSEFLFVLLQTHILEPFLWEFFEGWTKMCSSRKDWYLVLPHTQWDHSLLNSQLEVFSDLSSNSDYRLQTCTQSWLVVKNFQERFHPTSFTHCQNLSQSSGGVGLFLDYPYTEGIASPAVCDGGVEWPPVQLPAWYVLWLYLLSCVLRGCANLHLC